MKKILVLFALLFALPAHAAENCTSQPCSVLDFVQALQGPGQYKIEGFVIGKYTCPPCPAGAQCKPCAPNSITLSDSHCKLNKCSTSFTIRTDSATAANARIGQKMSLTVNVDIKTP